MTSAAAIAEESAIEQTSPSSQSQHHHHRQQELCLQGHHPQEALCPAPEDSPCGISSSNKNKNTSARDVIFDWAKSMNSATLTAVSSQVLISAAATEASTSTSNKSNSNSKNKNKSSSKKRKNRPSNSSPRTTMIPPPMVQNLDHEFQQVGGDADKANTTASANAAATAAPAAFLSAVHPSGFSSSSSSSATATAAAAALAASSMLLSPNPHPSKKIKRWGGLVQPTHSPQSSGSSNTQNKAAIEAVAVPPAPISLQLVTPTVDGIQHVARHLLGLSSTSFTTIQQLTSNAMNKNIMGPNEHPLVAMPTECTYEAMALIDWNKTESLSVSQDILRDNRLRHLQWAAAAAPISACSGSSLHMILPHDNLKLIDRLFSFPKKAYAIKQNLQEGCSTMNESRVVFQRLADHFWPGPVLIYLTVPPVPSQGGQLQQLKSPQQGQVPRQKVPQALLHRGPVLGDKTETNSSAERKYIGFRCPSHPLSVKVLRQVHSPALSRRESGSTSDGSSSSSLSSTSANRKVLVTSSIAASTTSSSHNQKNGNAISEDSCRLLLHGKEVARQLATQLRNGQQQLATTGAASALPSVQILQGEEKREMFTVPTCQFQDEWLECWIVQESRTVVIRGKSRRPLPSLTALFKLSSSADPTSSSGGGGMTSPPSSPAPFCSGNSNNRVVRSVLGQWKVVDQRN